MPGDAGAGNTLPVECCLEPLFCRGALPPKKVATLLCKGPALEVFNFWLLLFYIAP